MYTFECTGDGAEHGSLSLGLNCLGSVGCLQAENSEGENVTGEHRGRVILL